MVANISYRYTLIYIFHKIKKCHRRVRSARNKSDMPASLNDDMKITGSHVSQTEISEGENPDTPDMRTAGDFPPIV